MSNWFSFAISCLALIASGITLWLTFFRNGRLAMTQPTQIFFGPDGPSFEGGSKVYLRTLLYATAKRGYVLESLHLSLQRNETKQNFNIWVCGEKGDLNRGSGLFVPQEGVTLAHHFLLPEDGANFSFLAGTYSLSVYAKGVGQTQTTRLTLINLSISESIAKALSEPHAGLYFDWSPDQQVYHPHVQQRLGSEADFEKFVRLIGQKKTAE
jgi:hypothetical protein